jgi:hypothetical protein
MSTCLCCREIGKVMASTHVSGFGVQKKSRRSEASAELAVGLSAFEQSKGKCIPLGEAACVVGMQMVSAVVTREQLRWVARVAQDLVEIDHTIEFTAGANPIVDLLAHPFLLRREKSDRRVRGRHS